MACECHDESPELYIKELGDVWRLCEDLYYSLNYDDDDEKNVLCCCFGLGSERAVLCGMCSEAVDA